MCSILKYCLSHQAWLALFTLTQVVYSFLLPTSPHPASILPILISFAFSMVIYLSDLYLSTTNKLHYHAPPLPHSFFAVTTTRYLFFFCYHLPSSCLPLQVWQLSYDTPCQSEGFCLQWRIWVWLMQCLYGRPGCFCLVVLHCCLLGT